MNYKNSFIAFYKSKKINLFLLFLVIAILYSLLTKLSGNYTKTITLKVELENLPEEQVVINDSLNNLEVTIETFGFKFITYYLNKPTITLDVTQLDTKNGNYLWTESNHLSPIINEFGNKVKIKSIKPDSLIFKIDKNFVKKVPVELYDDILFSEGFDITETYKLEPDSIRLIGPKSKLDTIHFVTTKPLVLKDVQKSFRKKIEIEAPSTSLEIKLSSNEVYVSANVEKFTEGSLDIPVEIINVPNEIGIKYYPKTVKVVFFSSLTDYNTIKPKDFRIVCDYNISSQSTYLIPKLVKQPKASKNIRLQTKKIDYIITR